MIDIQGLTDEQYRDLYRTDWRTDHHVEARERGRKVLARERAVVAAAIRLDCETMLDAGCLDGYLALEACRAGLVVSLLDLDAEILAKARATLWLNGFFAPAVAVCGLIEDLDGFRRWDAVVCTEVIEHVRDPAAAVAALRRSADRAVILTTPVGRCYDDPLHLWHWEDEAHLAASLGLDAFASYTVERISSDGDEGRVFFVVAKV